MNEAFSKNFKIFSKEGLGSVRSLIKENGEVWFVGKDVCDILGIANARDAYSRLLEDEKVDISGANLNVCSTDVQKSHGGARRAKLVSESGLYMLVMGSRKPEAEAFQRWVTREILPSIRKNGGYIMGQEVLPDSQREMMENTIKNLSEECNLLAKKNSQLAWEADMFSRYYDETLNLYKELKARMEEQEASQKKAAAPMVSAKAEKDSSIDTKVIIPEKFVDQYGNIYFTRESAIEAIKAMRE